MVIDGREQHRDLILTPSEIRANWWRRQGHELTLSDLAGVLGPRVERLVVGTGAFGRMQPRPDLEETLRLRGVATEFLPTTQAVQRVNELLAAGADDWIAAFHLTC